MTTPHTPPTLAAMIHATLHTRDVCRVYSESLSLCWPEARDSDTLVEKITAFAAQNRWTLEFREFGKMGVAAEFRKPAKTAGNLPRGISSYSRAA
jgi:hypothetical protein